MTWQKKARLAIAIFLVGFVAVVVVALRRPKPIVEPAAIPTRVDPASVVETQGGLDFTHTKDGRTVYTVKAKGQRIYPDGRTVYQQATVDFPERSGRAVAVSANEAEVVAGKEGTRVGTLKLKGDVALRTSDGINVKAGEATYAEGDGILTVPGPVEFTRGRMKGTGIGATYDQNREVLWLLDQAHITVAPDATGTGAMDAIASSAGLARPEHYVRLVKGARITGDNRVIVGDDILMRLTEDDERIQMLELRGNSRITGTAQSMSARDIDLTYGPDGRSLQAAKLIENAVLQLPAGGGAPGRRIAGRAIDMTLSPDGSTVTSLNAVENVQVDLPADASAPGRQIRSAALTATGAQGAGLQEATFTGNVIYRETRAARGNAVAVNREARATRLLVKTSPGLGAIQQADFRGNVHITDGPTITADAPRVLYRVTDDRMDLSPGDGGDTGKDPQVTDGRVTIVARTIQFTPSTRRMKAETDVRSTILSKARAGAPAGQGGKMPAMLQQDKPVNVTSNRLDYDGEAGLATYAGNARLWQDKGTSIKAGTLIVDDKNGNLTARENVATLMTVSETDPKTKARKDTLTTGKAETFVYDDAKRMATYTTKAQLHGAQGDLTAEKIELFLAAKTNDLERLEAYGAVTVNETDRKATGTRLTYTAEDDQYVMTGDVGTPVVVIEQKADGACTRTQGTKLVFRRAVEGITMDSMVSRACTGGSSD